jgi:chorismate mutase
MMEEDRISELRKRIDSVDRTILRLLEERLKIAREIMKIKIKKGLKITDRKRESEILKNLTKKTKNEILKKYLFQIYRIIFKMSKMQRSNKIKK